MSSRFRLSLIFAIGCASASLAFVAGRWSNSRPAFQKEGAGKRVAPGPVGERTREASVAGGAEVGRSEAERLRRLDGQPSSAAREDERVRLIGRWAANDPEAALAYARSNLKGDRREQAVTAVFTTWARHDPNGAWAWVTTKIPGETPRLDEVIGEIGKANPSLAAQLASDWTRGHPDTGQELALAALEGMAYTGRFAEASQLIGTIVVRGEEDRAGLETFLAGQWARYQPAAAADWLKQMPEGPARDQAMMSLSVAWADDDPASAARFAFGLPAGNTRQSALQQVVSKWLAVDSTQARQWVINEGVHDDFDQAVASIATQPDLVSTQPGLALKWAGNIIDDTVRFQSLNTVLSNLYAQDPASVVRYIQESQDLTPGQRAEFRRRFPPPAK